MQGKLKSVSEIFKSTSKYAVPPYQRQYQWDEVRWQALASDVGRAADARSTDPHHWLGILLLSIENGLPLPGDDSGVDYSLIDGQQRLVTLLIWFAALVHHAKDSGQTVNLKLSDLATLSVQVSDQKALEVVIQNQWLEPRYYGLQESQILKAYRYFRFILWLGADAVREEYVIKSPSWKTPKSGETLYLHWERFIETSSGSKLPRGNSVSCRSLIDATSSRLNIFALAHDPHEDEPVASIFDTLNGMRTELEPLDHVRNSIFVRLTSKDASTIFDKYWAPAEEGIRDVRIRGLKPGVSFLYDFVISQGEKKRQGTISRLSGASHFSRMTREFNQKELAAYLKMEVVPAMLCWPVVIRKRDSAKYETHEVHFSKTALDLMDSIRDLSKNPANPLVLLYATSRLMGRISDKELESLLSLVENYLARQVLALTPLSPLRARMMDIASDIDRDTSYASLRKALRKGKWPSDAAIRTQSKRGQYGELDATQIGAIFRGIEKALSGRHAMAFKIGSNSYTIEHIYPKKDAKWQVDLGKWGSESKKMVPYLHTLGNLTVVAKEHNSKVGNSRFAVKQAHPSEIGNAAPLRIHDDWLKSKKWTEIEIQKRTSKLVHLALKHWAIPSA